MAVEVLQVNLGRRKVAFLTAEEENVSGGRIEQENCQRGEMDNSFRGDVGIYFINRKVQVV